MFVVNDDNSIYVTRGDTCTFSVTANKDGENYLFQVGDVLRIKVYGKKDAETVVLQKDFPVTRETESVDIFLTGQDTKIGEVISKPKDYWYEVELNPETNPQTIIGYDEEGARLFRLFPEGRDLTEDDPIIQPEDIPVVDKALDLTSPRPVENQAVTREILKLSVNLDKTNNFTETLAKDLSFESGRLNNLIAHDDSTSISKPLEYLDFITENTKAKIDGTINSDGVFATIKVNLREANLLYGGSGMEYFIIPNECRPIDIGLIHSEDSLEYSIGYDNANNRYYLSIYAADGVTVAPSSAGTVTMSYALADFEVKDIRVGADGEIYDTAGNAVRNQISGVVAEMHNVIEVDYPTNLVNIDKADFEAVGVSDCTFEYANHTLKVERNSAVNQTLTAQLKDLEDEKTYILSFSCTGLGEKGYVRLTDGPSGPVLYEINATSAGKYSGVFVGSRTDNLYLTVRMSYSIVFAIVSNISIIAADDTIKYTVNKETIKNLDAENMSEDFLRIIGRSANPCEYKGDEISLFSKILCVGDSLTSGVFNRSESGTTQFTTIVKCSYPAYLTKLSNVQCANKGNGGKTADGWYALHANDDLSGYDCAIIQLGVNDALQYGSWTDTSATAFTNIINKLKAQNKGIKIFVSTVIPATSYMDEKYDFVSKGIREFVAGLNDENVILLDMAEYGHTAEEDAYNCGHLSAYGYWQLAKDYKAYISWCINQNKALFREIQFIGTEYQYK